MVQEKITDALAIGTKELSQTNKGTIQCTQQGDDYNCGVFVCLNALSLALGDDVRHWPVDVDIARNLLQHIFYFKSTVEEREGAFQCLRDLQASSTAHYKKTQQSWGTIADRMQTLPRHVER